MTATILRNCCDGAWQSVRGPRAVDVTDLATGDVPAVHPMSDTVDLTSGPQAGFCSAAPAHPSSTTPSRSSASPA